MDIYCPSVLVQANELWEIKKKKEQESTFASCKNLDFLIWIRFKIKQKLKEFWKSFCEWFNRMLMDIMLG